MTTVIEKTRTKRTTTIATPIAFASGAGSRVGGCSGTVATLMWSAGVPAHVVQRRLGQAKTGLVPFHDECSVNPVATVSEGHLKVVAMREPARRVYYGLLPCPIRSAQVGYTLASNG